MPTLNFQLVTPERIVLSEELMSLTCPTEMGQITILPEHIPLVANLTAGEICARTATNEHHIFVTGGFIEVRGGRVVVLADAAEHNHEIDMEIAEQSLMRAEEDMRNAKFGTLEHSKAVTALYTSTVRIHVAKKHSGKASSVVGQSTFP